MFSFQSPTFDFNPQMNSGRVTREFKFNADVLEVGNTIVQTYAVNGRPWTSFVVTFDDMRALLAFWLQFPDPRNYVIELLRYGVLPTSQWVSLYAPKLEIERPTGEVFTPPDGTKIYAKTASGIACGFGEVEVNGKVRFMPVYGNDPSSAGIEGPNPGEEIHLYLAVMGSSGVVPLYSQSRILWTQNGARIEIPRMSLVARVAITKESAMASVLVPEMLEKVRNANS